MIKPICSKESLIHCDSGKESKQKGVLAWKKAGNALHVNTEMPANGESNKVGIIQKPALDRIRHSTPKMEVTLQV